MILFRNQIGKTLFTGTIHPASAKQKILDVKPYKVQLKIACLLKSEKEAKFEICHAVASFGRTDDRKEFMEAFDKEIAAMKKS